MNLHAKIDGIVAVEWIDCMRRAVVLPNRVEDIAL
jgi:hypothetical protein